MFYIELFPYVISFLLPCFENKSNPFQKWEEELNRNIFKEEIQMFWTKAQEKLLHTIYHKGDLNQKDNEISSHTTKTGTRQK